jgi:hypothetical protein
MQKWKEQEFQAGTAQRAVSAAALSLGDRYFLQKQCRGTDGFRAHALLMLGSGHQVGENGSEYMYSKCQPGCCNLKAVLENCNVEELDLLFTLI